MTEQRMLMGFRVMRPLRMGRKQVLTWGDCDAGKTQACISTNLLSSSDQLLDHF